MRHITLFILLMGLSSFSFAQPQDEGKQPVFGQTFVPDHIFEESDLSGWHILGHADWQAMNGTLTGRATSENGGWLILDKSYQDVGVHVLFKCTGGCETGILFRMGKTASGYTGVYLSLNEDDVKPYRLTLDEQGAIAKRERLEYAGGIWYRVAPAEDEENRGFHPPEGENSFPLRPMPKIDLPFERPDTRYRPQDWNQIEIFLDVNVIRSFLNGGREIGGHIGTVYKGMSGFGGYGNIALFAGGTGEVQFKNLMYKDIGIRVTPKEKSSPRFRVHRINDMFYSWGADAADFNQDGHMDVVAGPYIYYGPEFVERREIYPAVAVGPSQEFPSAHVQHTYDFNGDGWPDVLRSAFSTTLFINPQEELRRWESFDVLPDVRQGEITDFIDIDEDGVPELIYSGSGTIRFAKPNPGNPTMPWDEYIVSEEGYGLAHGIGTGDINGDGKLDILNAFGWWEQPEELKKDQLWKYHPEAFGRYGHRVTGVGGTIMAVYDVNGNGLNDVVTNLNAHGFGLAWYEQRRDGDGNISFTRHMISDDYSADNTGGVTFSQPHGATFTDVDGDGIKDFIVGKRYWTHLDNYYDPDPYGDPVIYWYRTIRDSEAPGGARFVPELIHNRSGAGSEITAVDINKDGAVDIITSTNRGTFIFWNTPRK